MDSYLIRKKIELAGYNFAKDFYNQWREEKDCFVEDDQDEIWYKESSDENGNILKDVFENMIGERVWDAFGCMDAYCACCDMYELNIPDDFISEMGGLDNIISEVLFVGVHNFIKDTYSNI